MTSVRPTRLEVDLDAVAANVRTLCRAAHGAAMCAVVKADGYGHGAVEVASTVLEAGAEMVAVALVEEAAQLRAGGIDAPILLLSEPPVAHAGRVLDVGATASVYTLQMLQALGTVARNTGAAAPAIHLVFDSGMGRVGAPEAAWAPLIDAAAGAQLRSEVEVEGIWTHFARADEDVPTTGEQLASFHRALEQARARGIEPRLVHAANSAATLRHPDSHFDMVRCGIAVYGLSPSPDVRADDHGLRQALRLVTEVSFAKRITAGTSVSYGHSWSAPADGWVATLPIGYADGVPRALSNRVDVLAGGVRRPMVGNVTMDQVLVWFADDEPAVGQEVVLLGPGRADGGGAGADAVISVDEWADAIPTISYEVACAISSRVPRIHLQHGDPDTDSSNDTRHPDEPGTADD